MAKWLPSHLRRNVQARRELKHAFASLEYFVVETMAQHIILPGPTGELSHS
jgi:hypothetical protein